MISSLKVLVLAQYFSPDMGGGSTRASNVVKGLLSKGCEVTVVAAHSHYPHGNVPRKYSRKAVVSERFSGAKVYRVWIPSLPHSSPSKRAILHLCFCISSLFALPFVGKVDVVWGANPNLFSFFPSLIYGVVKHVPLVRNVDDLWPEVFYELGYVKSKFAQRMLDLLAWLSYIVPAAITPISGGYKRSIVAKYGISPDKIHPIEVGVDKISPVNSDENSKALFTVMYSGMLGRGYDFDVVLDAASSLAENDDIVFVIRGVGEMETELKEVTRERRLGNVVLHTRLLPKDELATLLESADAFVLPMATMGFVDLGLPSKVFEYQAYGKPILCVSGGEAARYVEATQSGLVVKPGDVCGFAEAVVRLHKNRKLASKLGRNGWQHVAAALTTEKIGGRFREVLASVTHRQEDWHQALDLS
jgi:glycosyltransferase involved in cell wall biosynthesis